MQSLSSERIDLPSQVAAQCREEGAEQVDIIPADLSDTRERRHTGKDVSHALY